jgi:hypothetical protein
MASVTVSPGVGALTITGFVPTKLEAPTGAAGTATGDSIAMTFTDNTGGVKQHRAYVKRSTDSIWLSDGDLAAGETSHTFNWLVQDTDYDVGVTSFDTYAESGMSTDTDILTAVVRRVSGSFL